MVLSLKRVQSDDFLTKFDSLDASLIPSRDFVRNFGEVSDYVESHIYSSNYTLLYSNQSYTNYKYPVNTNILGSSTTVSNLVFDPVADLENLGYSNGLYTISYNIFRKKIYVSKDKPFFIKEISKDRKEVRLASTSITNVDIETGVLNFIYEMQNSSYYKDFLLNFGNNDIVNAVNIALDKSSENYTILVKLYQPLDVKFKEKDKLWVVEELSESHTFEIELAPDTVTEASPTIRSANFNIEFSKENNINSDYFNITDLLSNSSLTAYQKLLNAISTKQVSINVDYTNYSNFIHFSSIKERILNFVYKISLIENYQSDINKLKTVSNYNLSTPVSSSIINIQDKINKIIEKFDGYENHLYYESSSTSWPKVNSTPPYTLYGTTSEAVKTWLGSDEPTSYYYGGQIYSASIFDIENSNNLNFSTPEFINLDTSNASYQLFLNMVGQHFDNIWIYIKSISDIYDGRNAMNKGVSRDLIYHVLKGLGISLYNSSANDDIFDYLLGVSNSGSYAPVSESYQTLITASSQNVSGLDYNTELYKRIYHNVSYLLKTKGTSRGIKALISTYGIPSTILDVVDYGGSDKNSNTIEYSYDRFTYSLINTGSSYFKINWAPLTDNVVKYGSFDTVADSVELRFKPDTDNIKNRELILAVAKSGSIQDTKFAVWMDYTSSDGIPSANINFAISGSSGFKSSSLLAPIYITGSDGDSKWWNLLLKRQYTRNSNQNNYEQTYYLYVKNKIGDSIGHQYSSSIYFSGSLSSSYNDAWTNFGTTSSMHYMYVGGVNYTSSYFDGSNNFVGNLQEFRLWAEPLTEDVFNIHVLNPESIQGNSIDSAYNSLSARFTLGNNLLTYNHYLTQSLNSTHPNYNLYYSSGSYSGATLYGSALYGYGIYGYSGSGTYTISINTASFHGFSNKNNYSYFTEEYNAVSPNAGYYNPVNHKIRISTVTGSSAVLSPDISFEEPAYITKDVHFTDVSFSPQNEIDKDIIAHFGSTLNLDDYIGDVRQETSSSYISLESVKKNYYKKFVSKYNYQDFIKLIKYFDGSLFKMIKDFSPVRTNMQTGITIKSPILERNKVKRNHPNFQNDYNYYSASLLDVGLTSPYERVSGYGDRRDFYTGELTGSLIDVNLQFNKKNYNPYVRYTSSLDTVKFSKSNFNVLYSNVTESITSRYIRYEDKPTNTITYPARVQDFYYKYKRHSNPRYDGSRLNSARLNYYTVGDDSYDKSSNVNSNVSKFAWINKISEKNLNFYDKTSVNIKYLIDPSSSVYELTLENKNIFEVQNTFKSGDTLVLSLFDPYNPTLQLGLNGSKRIWQGGFSFSPVLYREGNENLLFRYINPTSTYTTPIGVRSVFRSINTWYNNANNDFTFATVSQPVTGYPEFTIDGSKQASKFSLSSGPYSSWQYSSYVSKNFNGTLINGYGGTTSYSSDWFLNWYNLDFFLTDKTGSSDNGYNTSGFESAMSLIQNSYEKYTMFTSPKDTTYIVNVSFPFEFSANHVDSGPGEFQVVGFVEKSVAGGPWQIVDNKKSTFEIISIPTTDTVAYNAEESMIWYDPASTVFSPSMKVNCVIRNLSVALSTGDKLRVKFFFIDKRTTFLGSTNFTFTMMQGNANYGYFEVLDAVNSIIVPIRDYSIYGSSNLFTGSYTNPKKLTFLHSASIAYGNVIFTPSGSTTSSYSNVISAFDIQQGDLIRFGNFQTINATYYTVDYVVPPVIFYNTSSQPSCSAFLEVYTKEDMSVNNISSNNFAILRKYPDETSIILDYPKTEGGTSKGIAIPNSLKEDVKKEIANILKPIKDNLLLGSG